MKSDYKRHANNYVRYHKPTVFYTKPEIITKPKKEDIDKIKEEIMAGLKKEVHGLRQQVDSAKKEINDRVNMIDLSPRQNPPQRDYPPIGSITTSGVLPVRDEGWEPFMCTYTGGQSIYDSNEGRKRRASKAPR